MNGAYTLGEVDFASAMASADRLIASYRCTAPGAVRYVSKLPVLPTLPFSDMMACWNGAYAGPLVSVTRLSAWKLLASVGLPTAAATDLYQSGEIVADVPMTGIILPALSCFTSDRNVASAGPSASVRITSGCAATILSASVRNVLACRSRLSLAASVMPALPIAVMAGWMKVWEPMSLPNASATSS